MARVDYDQMAPSYDRGRLLSLEGLEGWRATLAAWLPPPDGLPVLDLGAGTGLFATAIATWFDVGVVAVEPSAGMRHQARQVRRQIPVPWWPPALQPPYCRLYS
jgi:ubiquinone/menaquinone biosynthesis C-methylase UbiE